eukprot:CAMPEP_0204517148 /NCGR_PEP_ID=MMETSP0661-20131031/3505_1 /ASSEMBLY_ACC=CAM_ASM_000606 /TAXON_ID=109239 /ORGANISM="Alexandrium margalefi, Strain AMGDE01CS-322" /LENGTH=134 /DNA_ID=CAMNT_0051522537 /DNA_START=68 /DNA_END=472 /DNA_ORIENTATION=-
MASMRLAVHVLLLVVGGLAEQSTDTTCAEDCTLSHVAVSAIQKSVGESPHVGTDEGTSNLVASLKSHVQTVAEAAGDKSQTLGEVEKKNEPLQTVAEAAGDKSQTAGEPPVEEAPAKEAAAPPPKDTKECCCPR